MCKLIIFILNFWSLENIGRQIKYYNNIVIFNIWSNTYDYIDCDYRWLDICNINLNWL